MRRSIFLPLIGLITVSCSGGSATPAAGAAGGPPPPVAVTTALVVQKPMAVNVRAVGAVEASSTVEVRAQVAGELLTVGFAEGQDVKAGQLLFTIDPRPFEVALRQAEATLARDSAQLKNAEAQRARAGDLLKNGLLSRADFETSTTAAEALAATVAVDRALVDTATLQLQRTKVFAPVAGRTGALLAHPGALIRANDASPLVVINQIAPAYVSFAIPARIVSRLDMSPRAKRAAVEATLPGGAGAATGQVTFVDNAVDTTSDTIRVKATFPNRERTLWPGAFVDVVLRLAVDERALVVPAAAVLPGQQGEYVYVVQADSTVDVRPVTVAWTEGREAVIQRGLEAGETVVIDGQLRLTPGARVNAKPPDQSKSPRP
jgi:multidrug efflux system membrane fusion protein